MVCFEVIFSPQRNAEIKTATTSDILKITQEVTFLPRVRDLRYRYIATYKNMPPIMPINNTHGLNGDRKNRYKIAERNIAQVKPVNKVFFILEFLQIIIL